MIQTPKQEIFDDIKAKAIDIRNTYDDYGYRSEKLNIINGMENIRDNALYIAGMFDSDNYTKLYSSLSEDSKDRITNRFIS